MDYTKHYNLLINKAKNREEKEGVYYEKHHIKLRSEGGTNEESNIVKLTAREHFVAHWLLYREIPSSYVRAEAFRMMCDVDPSTNKRRYTPGSRIVAEAREASARLKSELYKKKCWVKKDGEQRYIFKQELEIYEELGWQRGKNYSPSKETREKLRQSRLNEKPRGEEFRKKMSKVVSERYKKNPESWKKSKETKEKIRQYNLRRSPEVNKKISETRKKSIVKCPHCGKVGNISIMKRWHFDNCKNKT